jgi:diguanylate cyclase (GGDEF)-like protein
MRPSTPFGFRGRLLAAMLSLVVITSLGLGAVIMFHLFSQEKQRAAQQLDVAENVARQTLESRTRLLISNLSIVVQDFGFKSAIASRDLPTITSALANHSERTGAEVAMLADRNGELIAGLQDLEPGSELPFEELLDRARDQGTASDIVSWRDSAYQILVIPVEGAGLRAWMVAGFPLDNAFARFISDLTQTGVVFSRESGDQQQELASSFEVDATKMPDTTDAPTQQNIVETQGFFTRALVLGDREQSQLRALLLIDRAEALEAYYALAIEIALLTLGALAVAVILVLFVARALGRPVLELAHFAPPRRLGGGELAILQKALSEMQRRVRDREHQIRYDAEHDELSDLPNRKAMEQQLARDCAAGTPLTVIAVSIHGFKTINETLGFSVGDQALMVTGLRLRGQVPADGMVGRTGGNEFIILTPELNPQRLETLTDAIRAHVEQVTLLNESPIRIEVEMAFLSLPQDGATVDEVRRRVKLTLEQARHVAARWARYQSGGDEEHLRELQLIRDLEAAVQAGDLYMHYQPKLDMQSLRVTQVEALVRWHHSELGFINPEEFIRLAEQSGQTLKLTQCIMEQIARDTALWRSSLPDTGIAINLSALDLDNSGLSEQIRALFEPVMPMDQLTFEVTESALMSDAGAALKTLRHLRDLGIHVAVDDFGTGYSSLAQLRQLPVTELKIDKSFVLNLDTEAQDQLIVRSTLDLAHGLGLSVVAEGVENLESWRLLQRWHCEQAQGFYMARPMPAGKLAEWAEAFHAGSQELLPHNQPSHEE